MSDTPVGVIGAGTMGRQVAYHFAKYGCEVVLLDISDEILHEATREIGNIARLDRLLGSDADSKTEGASERISTTTEISKLAKHPFVIENATEKISVKEQVYQDLADVVADEAIVASNTSAISITKLSSYLPSPERVLGIHFMNPVYRKPTVEVIRGHHTSEATLGSARELLESVQLRSVVVNDFPGFVSNRVLMLTINEAVFAVQDGVAEPESVDRIFKECFGHDMGPLETADLIGLDTILDTLRVLLESYGDGKFRPAPLLQKMVDAGLLGRKSGRGFFTYDGSASDLG